MPMVQPKEKTTNPMSEQVESLDYKYEYKESLKEISKLKDENLKLKQIIRDISSML